MKTTIIFLSCLFSLQLFAATSTGYFYGEMTYYSADGNQAMGTTMSLVERTVNPEENIITELVFQPSNQPGGEVRRFTTYLKREDKTNVFNTSDLAGSFSGKVTFEGKEWAWDKWTYDIQVSGGRLTGTGALSAAGIVTEKNFMKKDGTVVQKIRENLKTITKKQYQKRLKEMGK